MEDCVLSWWQQGWFVSLIPIIAGILGWLFKALCEYLKPYKRDQQLIEEIKSILDNRDGDNFIENMKFFVVGNPIPKNLLYKLHDLRGVIFQRPEYFFLSKKVQQSFQQLKNNTNRYSQTFIDTYELNGNVFTLYKPYKDCPNDKRKEMELLYKKRNDELAVAQEEFLDAYDNFVVTAQKELYKDK